MTVRRAGLGLAIPLAAILASACGGSPAPGTSREDPRREAVIRFWRLSNDATAFRMKRDLTAAVRAYEEALALDPRHEDSLYYLGQCRQELRRYDEARSAYARLVEVNPASARGHLALGALLASPDEKAPLDLAAAEEHLRRAHEINGEETGALVRLGEILILRGRLAEAREWLEAAVRTNPKSVEAPFLAGYLRWIAGDPGGAQSFYRKATGAARPEAPIRGVLSEGDRRAPPSEKNSRVAAPPLRAPMGKTLFGSFSAHLREGERSARTGNLSAADLDQIYRPVRDFATRLARRASLPPGPESLERGK